MRILVAEDERITRVSLVRQLESWGHTVAACEDGEQAWDKFGAGEFDVVLTDWEMPRLSGLDLIKRIRAAGNTRFVYIIMLTSRSDKADLVSGIEAGADDFLSKPFDREELRVRLLAGERIVTLERTLNRQNAELRDAGERMHNDLRAAARVQRALLPSQNVVTTRARSAWGYVPTDELAGDAIGLHLISDRYLVSYVLDVSGHGVPAALLSVSAMHALAPVPVDTSLLRDASASGPLGNVRPPAHIAAELNRRFKSSESDGRYFTMVLCILDTDNGRLHFTGAGHPLPLILRGESVVEVEDVGGLPIAILDESEYTDGSFQLAPGDRVCLYSDGFLEQYGAGERGQLGMKRLVSMLVGLHSRSADEAVKESIAGLAEWAGGAAFADDVSMVLIDWIGE